MKMRFTALSIVLFLSLACSTLIFASGKQVYRCATSEDVYRALAMVEPGDTILLQGGTVYEIDKSFELEAHGSDSARITLTSQDSTGQDRYAVISTMGGKKEANLAAVRLSGSYWNVSEEIVKLAGFGNTIKGNKFVGSNENLNRYIHIFNKKTDHPVRVAYRGQENIPAPTGRDNTVINNIFHADDPSIQIVRNDLADADRASARIENNKMESLE
jgi:hypothetical protein